MAKRGPKPKNKGINMENQTKSDENAPEIKETTTNETIQDDKLLPKKSLFRIDEVADYFGVTDRTINLWAEHGHLKKEKIVGVARFSRESILKCRFRKTMIKTGIS